MTEIKKLRTLLVTFDNTISSRQTSAFRGAVIEKVGREHQLFHNHLETGFNYQYPLIQYKSIHRRPAFFCVGPGVDEIHHFFGLRNWSVEVHGEKLDLQIHKLDLNTFNLNVWDKTFAYSIRDWLALNAENYKRFQDTPGLADRIRLMEKLLVGNILSFAKGVDWHIQDEVRVQIDELKNQKMIRYKGVPLMAFDVSFRSNVFLPNYVGLGKSASHGFGVVSLNSKSNK